MMISPTCYPEGHDHMIDENIRRKYFHFDRFVSTKMNGHSFDYNENL